MKRFCLLLLSAILYIVIVGCGRSSATKAADDLISAIGTVSLNSGDAIISAEVAVNALSDKEK